MSLSRIEMLQAFSYGVLNSVLMSGSVCFIFLFTRALGLHVIHAQSRVSNGTLEALQINQNLIQKEFSEVAGLSGSVDMLCGANRNLCVFKDSVEHFSCLNGERVPQRFVNDGLRDCVDASDEYSIAVVGKAWYMSHYFTLKSEDRDLSRFQSLGRRSYVAGFPALRYARGNDKVRVNTYLLLNMASGGGGALGILFSAQKLSGIPPPTHKGIGLLLEDVGTGAEMCRLDIQTYAAVWTTSFFPVPDVEQNLIGRRGDLFDWSANAMYTTYSRSFRMWSQDWRQEVHIAATGPEAYSGVVGIVDRMAFANRKYWLFDVHQSDGRVAVSSYACEKVFDSVMLTMFGLSIYGKEVNAVVDIGQMHLSLYDLRFIDIRDAESHAEVSSFYQHVEEKLNRFSAVESSMSRAANHTRRLLASVEHHLGFQPSHGHPIAAGINVLGASLTLYSCHKSPGTWVSPAFYHADVSPYDMSDTPVKYVRGGCPRSPFHVTLFGGKKLSMVEI